MKKKRQYEKLWEGMDLFGFDVIDFRVFLGGKYSYWRLFINVNKTYE